jgi:hypothetical protein
VRNKGGQVCGEAAEKEYVDVKMLYTTEVNKLSITEL